MIPNKWNFFKSTYNNNSFRLLFLSTFTTLIATIALRYKFIENQVPEFQLINLKLILFSLVMFFVSSVTWIIGEFFTRVRINETIRDYANINDFLEKERKIADEEFWPEISYQKTIEWNKSNQINSNEYHFLLWCMIISFVLYILAFLVFLAGIFEFLHQIIPYP